MPRVRVEQIAIETEFEIIPPYARERYFGFQTARKAADRPVINPIFVYANDGKFLNGTNCSATSSLFSSLFARVDAHDLSIFAWKQTLLWQFKYIYIDANWSYNMVFGAIEHTYRLNNLSQKLHGIHPDFLDTWDRAVLVNSQSHVPFSGQLMHNQRAHIPLAQAILDMMCQYYGRQRPFTLTQVDYEQAGWTGDPTATPPALDPAEANIEVLTPAPAPDGPPAQVIILDDVIAQEEAAAYPMTPEEAVAIEMLEEVVAGAGDETPDFHPMGMDEGPADGGMTVEGWDD